MKKIKKKEIRNKVKDDVYKKKNFKKSFCRFRRE